MTEEQFDRKVEDAAARFEETVERAADRLDQGLTASYRKHKKGFRIVQVVVALCLVLGFWLVPGVLGKVCGWLGIAGLIGAVVQWIVFR